MRHGVEKTLAPAGAHRKAISYQGAFAPGYSLCAPPGRDHSKMHGSGNINKSSRSAIAGTAEPFRVSPPEAVVYLDGIRNLIFMDGSKHLTRPPMGSASQENVFRAIPDWPESDHLVGIFSLEYPGTAGCLSKRTGTALRPTFLILVPIRNRDSGSYKIRCARRPFQLM
jgi:hypothetical protein